MQRKSRHQPRQRTGAKRKAKAAADPAQAKVDPPLNTPAGEKELVARAYRKVMAGSANALTRPESEALKRHEKLKEEQLRWRYYRTIPQKHWKVMSGRQTKVLAEQAQRYGLPFGSASIDLPAVVKSLHDFLADNAQKLAQEDEMLVSGSSVALERYRRERAALARLDRLERQRRVLPREQIREALGRVAAILRGAGEALGRQFGPGAVELLYEALDDAQREIDRSLERLTHPSTQSEQPEDRFPDHDDDPTPSTECSPAGSHSTARSPAPLAPGS